MVFVPHSSASRLLPVHRSTRDTDPCAAFMRRQRCFEDGIWFHERIETGKLTAGKGFFCSNPVLVSVHPARRGRIKPRTSYNNVP